jgi:hypothetical protein
MGHEDMREPIVHTLRALPALHPSPEILTLYLHEDVPENLFLHAPDLFALTTVTDLTVAFGMSTPAVDSDAAPPFFVAWPLLRHLRSTSYGPLLITEAWSLPQLTRLELENLSFLSEQSVLASTLPALRELRCNFAHGLDSLPPLPPSLTRLVLHIQKTLEDETEGMPVYLAEAGQRERALRWTDASPLSDCPALTALSLVVEFPYDAAARVHCAVNIPQEVAKRLSECKVEVRQAYNRRVKKSGVSLIRAPISLQRLVRESSAFRHIYGKHIYGRGTLELKASEVEWVSAA